MHELATDRYLVTQFSIDKSVEKEDSVATEEPLETKITFTTKGLIVEKTIAITMRTPGEDEALAIGFLFTEGIIQNRTQIQETQANFWAPNRMCIQLKEGTEPKLDQSERNFYTTSSCGVCGKASIDAIKTQSSFDDHKDHLRMEHHTVLEIGEKLNALQKNFQTTGGIHASALFDTTGKFIKLMEDVGRHNALDKLIGWAFLENTLPLQNHVLLLSGRISFELVQKANMAGIRVILAFGAPSTLAIETAKAFDITLIGFLKPKSFNLYTGLKRIITP